MNGLKILSNIIFFTLILMVAFKVFIFILPAIAILLGVTLFMNMKLIKQVAGLFKEKREYQSVPGRTYKLCGYCEKKADRHAPACAFCGRAFE